MAETGGKKQARQEATAEALHEWLKQSRNSDLKFAIASVEQAKKRVAREPSTNNIKAFSDAIALRDKLATERIKELKTIENAQKIQLESQTAPKKRGRKKIIPDLQQVEKLAAQGLSSAQIAKILGIARSTLYSRRSEFSEFSDALKKGRAQGEAAATSKLMEAIDRGEAWAICFYLKCICGWSEKGNINESRGQWQGCPQPEINVSLAGMSPHEIASIAKEVYKNGKRQFMLAPIWERDMARTGRPKIKIDLDMVRTLAARGLTDKEIARCLGIGRDTIIQRKKQDADFRAAIQQGRAQGIAPRLPMPCLRRHWAEMSRQ